jgi:predicted NBD/HSP70 family sugar kinase
MALSNADIRSANVADVYRALRDGGASTRSELTRVTGLALPTVSAITRYLLDEGLVQEVLQSTTARGGRPPSRLHFAVDARVVVTIRFAGSEVEALAANLEGATVARSTAPRVPTDEPWTATAEAFCSQIGDLLEGAAVGGALGAIALCVPGVTNRVSGTWTRPGLAGWLDVPIVSYLVERFGVPTTIINTAASALIGQLADESPQPASAMMLWVSRGVGGATVVAGRLIEGAAGSAGEIGHSRLRGGDILCECGRRGCVMTVTRVPYIKARFEALTGRRAPATLLEMENTATRPVLQMLEQVADDLAYAASWGVNVVNPAVFYLGGNSFMDGSTRLFSEFRLRLLAYSHEPNAHDLVVATARTEDAALGAVAVASELLPPLLRPGNGALTRLLPGLGSIDNKLYKTLP